MNPSHRCVAYPASYPKQGRHSVGGPKTPRAAGKHVPTTIRFQTKPQIALAQIKAALAAGVSRGVVLMDSSSGTDSKLRAGISALGLYYAAAILPTIKVRAVAAPQARVNVKQLALGLPKHA